MRALSTETDTDNGTSCARCAEKNKMNCCSHETLLHRSLTCDSGVDPCHHLNLGNFLSDHQLLHSWDFHDVLCRHDSHVD